MTAAKALAINVEHQVYDKYKKNIGYCDKLHQFSSSSKETVYHATEPYKVSHLKFVLVRVSRRVRNESVRGLAS
jgi:outer membrane protease